MNVERKPFSEKKYRISILFAASQTQLRPIIAILSTVAGLNLICKPALSRAWQQRVQPRGHLELKLASCQEIQPYGDVVLFVDVRDLITNLWVVVA